MAPGDNVGARRVNEPGFVALHDPQRAAFAVFEGSFDD